jgi:hypothetical protein
MDDDGNRIGKAKVIFKGKQMTIDLDLEGLPESCDDGDCFVMIHRGTSCDRIKAVLYDKEKLHKSPWGPSDSDFMSVDGDADLDFETRNGFGYDRNKGKVIVVYAKKIEDEDDVPVVDDVPVADDDPIDDVQNDDIPNDDVPAIVVDDDFIYLDDYYNDDNRRVLSIPQGVQEENSSRSGRVLHELPFFRRHSHHYHCHATYHGTYCHRHRNPITRNWKLTDYDKIACGKLKKKN